MSQHIPLSRLIDLLNEKVHFSVSSRHVHLMYPECLLIHSDRQKCGAHTIRVSGGLILHWKRKIAGQIHNYRIRETLHNITIARALLTCLFFKWSLHWYPASFLIFVQRLSRITGREQSGCHCQARWAWPIFGPGRRLPWQSGRRPYCSPQCAGTHCRTHVHRLTSGGQRQKGVDARCPSHSWDVCAVKPASMVWSAAGAMVTLSAPPPPAATPDLRRVTPSDTQGLLGQCEIGEERRAAAPFCGCPAAARRAHDFCMKGLKEGPSIFPRALLHRQKGFSHHKRAHHITKGHYYPTWGPFPPPKKPNYAINYQTALSTAKQALEGF